MNITKTIITIMNKSNSLTRHEEALLFAYVGSRSARYPINETESETQANAEL